MLSTREATSLMDLETLPGGSPPVSKATLGSAPSRLPTSNTAPPLPGLESKRVIGRFTGPETGPTLVLVGGLHGNEPAGVLGIRRVFESLERSGIPRGSVVGLAGNLEALGRRQRYLEADLNRHWLPERVARLEATDQPLAAEDHELRELLEELRKIQVETPEGERIYLLDIHTFSAPGIAFTPLEDSLPNRAFASEFHAPVVLGLEEELSGTLTSWASANGMVASGFESGQHDEAEAVDRAEAAVWIAFEAAGLFDEGLHPEVSKARRRLEEECRDLPAVVEVRYRHAITQVDAFRMDVGFENFQEITEGLAVGRDRQGPVEAPLDSLILMPLYQRQGADGFFLVRPVHPLWLELSALVRRFRFDRFVHWLPGVERRDGATDTFVVDRQRARFLALEIFHLLGFQRQSSETERHLVMSRRAYDEAARSIRPIRGRRPRWRR